MRYIIITSFFFILSCSTSNKPTFELTKEEATNSYIYPIGMSLSYTNSFEDREVTGEDITTNWIVLTSPNSDLWISALTDTNFSVPTSKYLELEANKLIESDSTAKIIGTSNQLFNDYEIPFIHLSASNSLFNKNCNSYSLGVIELNKRQLQVHINEQLNSNENTSDFLNNEIREILNSLEFK